MLTAVLAIYTNICIYKKRRQIDSSRVESYIEACCIWMLCLFTVTELLSIWHMVRFVTLFAVWAVLDVLLLVILWLQIRRSGFQLKEWCRHRHPVCALRRHPYDGIIMLLGAAVLLLAFFTTPHNWDSMTYHLSRIAYWVQNRSVEHYATNNIREIASPVLGEFVNLHVYILMRGSDRLLNLLQAFSYITCAVMAGQIAGRLGCSRAFRFLAALLYMTMPIAYAEALTTQVDNFATVWLLFYVYMLLGMVRQNEKLRFEGWTVSKVCILGLCVAWGYLTKPSVCVAMVIFAVWLLISCVMRKDKVKDLLRLALCALPCVILPLLPEAIRNFRTFQSYASKTTGARQLVGTLDPAYLFINFLKNFTFNMPTVLIRDSDVFFAKFATKAAEILRVDLNALSISEDGRPFGLHEPGTYGCDTAINPVAMWLFIFCVLWVLCTFRRTDRKGIKAGYFLASTISFCVFCAVLRWEPFVSRYMVSYFALLCPMIAVRIQRGTEAEKRRPLRHAVIGIVGFLCVTEAISLTAFYYDVYAHQGADNRPYGYFTARRDETVYYAQVTDDIKGSGYNSVGLYLLKADDYEYPIWKMLGKQRIEHVNVRNESTIYADPDFTPDCIIWFGQLPEETVTVNGAGYELAEDYGELHYLLVRR